MASAYEHSKTRPCTALSPVLSKWYRLCYMRCLAVLLLALFRCFQKTVSACLVEMSDPCCVHSATVVIASSVDLCLELNALPITFLVIKVCFSVNSNPL